MGFPLKTPKPEPRSWRRAAVVFGALLLFAAVNVSVWAFAIYFHRIPGVALPPMKAASPPYNPGVTLTEVLVTDLRGEKSMQYRAAGYPPPFDSVPRYRTLRRKTVSPDGALFHVRFSYGDGTTNEISLLREEKRLVILCGDARSLNGDERSATEEDIVDFLDSAWAMDVCADLRSYDPDEFARGLARREELGDKLTEELCDQLAKPDVFGHAIARLRLLLRPTQGVPLQIGPSLFGFNPEGHRRAEVVREALFVRLQACYSSAPEMREPRACSLVGPICDLLYWLMNAESDDRLTEMLATTTAPSWHLLDLSRRRASMPAVEQPMVDCISGMTSAEIAKTTLHVQNQVNERVRDWLTLRKELVAMTPEARLEHTMNAWDEYLGVNWERFSDSVWGSNLREESWSRIVSLGPPAAPLARQRERNCVGLLDRAFWHSITVYLGEEIDNKLVARLINERDQSDTVYSCYRQMAKLILQAGKVSDIAVKYPELANIYHSPLDGLPSR